MTVKVVSDGPIKTKRITCPTCAYELEFTGEDVTLYIDSDFDAHRSIVCPRETCKQGKIAVSWP